MSSMHETLRLWHSAGLEATDWFKCLRGAMPINSPVSLLLVTEICINEGWIIKERGWITRDKKMAQEWELKRKELRRRIQSSERQCATHSSHTFPPHLPHFDNSNSDPGWIWRCQNLILKAAERWKLFLHASPVIFRSICSSWLYNRTV